jgi:hypothetical protein
MYKLLKDIFTEQVSGVQRTTDGACIPFDNANSDFTQFKKDLADGAELQNSEGKVIDGLAYLATLDKEQQ